MSDVKDAAEEMEREETLPEEGAEPAEEAAPQPDAEPVEAAGRSA